MLYYAQAHGKDGWKINACDPGCIKTDINGKSGTGSMEHGARNAVRLATLEGWRKVELRKHIQTREVFCRGTSVLSR
jgi:hypothetical protein